MFSCPLKSVVSSRSCKKKSRDPIRLSFVVACFVLRVKKTSDWGGGIFAGTTKGFQIYVARFDPGKAGRTKPSSWGLKISGYDP